MSKLNKQASELAGKYIRQTSPENVVDTRKMRGLQAEINKLDAIRKVILNNNVDDRELIRFRTELNKLYTLVNNKVCFDTEG